MRRLCLRKILAVLALALQALTFAYGVGASPAAAHSRGEAGICDALGAAVDRRAPAGGHRDTGACLVCQYCLDGFSPFVPLSVADHLVDRRGVAAADRMLGATIGLGFDLACAHRARAPPASA